jgi:hypothetical protein
MSECRGCGQEAEWARFASGKVALFDMEMVEPGEGKMLWELIPDPTDEEDDYGKVIIWAERVPDGQPGRECHWATCPNKEDFKK